MKKIVLYINRDTTISIIQDAIMKRVKDPVITETDIFVRIWNAKNKIQEF